MESCQSFSISSCSQLKIAWFDVNGTVEDRYQCINAQVPMHRQKKKKCKIHEDNCRKKTEKNNIPMSEEQCQSCNKSICRAHSMRIWNSCLQ